MSQQLTVRMADPEDRQRIYELRHEVYARELCQHPINEDERLSDRLDEFNVYIVAMSGGELVGFVSVTPPGHGAYSIDKYLDRGRLPFSVNDSLYEIRVLTVVAEHRNSSAAFLLMYASAVWIWARGGTRIMAIGRDEVRSLYSKAGMQGHGIHVRSGAVEFELMSAEVAALHAQWPRYLRLLRHLQGSVDWQLPLPYLPPLAAFHGGESVHSLGPAFEHLDQGPEIVGADVLDAWFPPAPGILSALRSHLPLLARTSPPTPANGLIETISEVRGVPADCIALGAGSSSLIFLALREWLNSSSRVLVLDPSYGEYSHLCENVIGCRVDRHTLDPTKGYMPDLAELAQTIAQGYDLVVIVNPNNPTGRYIPRASLEELIEGAPSGTRFWIDEAYIDYVASDASIERFAARRADTVVCKSMSKVYALSGLRVAYLCGPRHLISGIRSITAPWSVGTLAQMAAIQALRDPCYYAEQYATTHELREILRAGLVEIGITDVVPGEANYLLCHLPPAGPDAATVHDLCRASRVYLRVAGATSLNLGKRAIRIAVRDEVANVRMLEVLRNALGRAAAEHPA